MKGKFRNKIIGSCMVLVCLLTILFVKGILTEASDTTTEEIQLVTISNYTSSALETEISNQRANNYIYAGLYKSGTTVEKLVAKNVVTETNVVEGSTYVAKFVPEGVMGIKAQVSEVLLNNPDSTTSSIRFVTAIDSLLYKEVGFSITRESDTEGENPIQLVKEGTISKYVYEKLYGVDVTAENPGEPMEYIPQDIHALANFFKTYTITSVPESAYNTDLTIRPYWITHDGQTVYGTTGIKTVNFGRSWVYVNTTANADATEYGTYDHPFTDLAVALDAIVLDNNGKIVIQSSCENSTFTVPSNFSWKKHGKDLTITGEGEKTETLDFSNIQTLIQRDGVTFSNMTLKLYTDGALYANGNRLLIDDNVSSENASTTIYGGGTGATSSVLGTDITILAGSYKAIYGGGRLGTVDGDTHVTVRNANVYSTTGKNESRYVCGGGKNGNVTGSTYVTIGEDFNKELEWETDATLSLVCGGGNADSGEEAIVEKNTYVVIEDGARTNHVYGAGVGYSNVKGKSHVTCDGGYSMSIYGGGAKNASNANTSVVMKDGKVVQIFGGNREGMTGSADVHILGGSVLRRVYGGCYNDYTTGWDSTVEVDGYVSVTFGPDTYASLGKDYVAPDGENKYDEAYLASSRYGNTTNETGVFVLNDYDENPNKDMVGYSTFFKNIKKYHYFVQSTIGGAVYSEGDSIRVVPDEDKVATVRVNNPEENVGTVHAYITSEGVCKLPTYDNADDVQHVYVVFTDSAPSDVTVGNYEATANGTHYATLEEALSVANTLSTTTEKEVVVNLLKENITVDSTLNIAESAKIKIQNAKDVTATINRSDDSNLLNVEKGAELSVMDVILDGRKTEQLTVTDIVQVEAGSASLINVSGDLIIDGTTIQYAKNACEGAAIYVDGGSVTMEDGKILNNYASGTKSGGAVSLKNSATFTMKTGTISNNTAEGGSGGAFMVRTNSKLTIEKGIISDNKATVSGTNGGGAIFAHYNTTVDITGGTFDNNKASSGNGGAILAYSNSTGSSNITIKNATISNNGSQNGGAVYVVAGAKLTLEGGAEFSNNIATANGGALAVLGTVTEKEGTSCTFTGNQAVKGGAIYISGTFTMRGSNLAENTSGDTDGYGGGVYVDAGTFVMAGGTISAHGSETKSCNITGAGVFVNGGTFNMTAGTIEGNHTTGNGAGIVVKPNATFTMSGGYIQNNTTEKGGGGIFTQSLNTTISDDAVIQNNIATGNGGGVYVHNSGILTMTGGTIYKNQAVNGGAIYIENNTAETTNVVSNGIIKGNIATGNGGGIYVLGKLDMTGGTITEHGTTEDRTSIVGAGVYVANTATFTMSGDKAYITKNHSTGKGAGIAVEGTFNLNSGNITYNTGVNTNNASNGEGAGVYALGTGVVTMTGGSISYNEVSGSGAGVSVSGTSKFTMDNGEISHNTATGSGGGMIVRSTRTEDESPVAAFVMNGGELSGNSALVTGKNGGGAIFQSTGTMVEINDGDIFGNTSKANGGAIFANPGTNGSLLMTDGAIKENIATLNGGGVYVNSGSFTMSKGEIIENTAANGGGICQVLSTNVSMSDGTIQGNIAIGTITDTETVAGKGSGVYVATSSDSYAFTMTGGNISGHGDMNTSNVVGAGVYVEINSHFKLQSNGQVKENRTTANGAGIAVAGKVSMSGGIITGNTSSNGGGIYVLETGTLVTNNSAVITLNTATNGGGVYNDGGTFNMKRGTISNNEAANGGGVYVNGGEVTMSTDTINNNYPYKKLDSNTATNGGGVYVNAGIFTMSEGTISNNIASVSGGGIYVHSIQTEMVEEDGTTVEKQVPTFVMNAGTISGNCAQSTGTVAGGAIYQDENTLILIDGGTISENTTTGGCGGAIYMASGAELTVSNGHITGNTSKNQAGAIYGAGANKLYFTGEGKIQGNKNNGGKAVQAILLAQSTTSTQVNLNSSFTIGGEGYSDEIRFNNLSNRDTSNPILIINGTLGYKLTLGFHDSNFEVYIQCHESDVAVSNKDNILQNSTTKEANLTSDGTYIKVTK